jgi:hypothetical protein
MALYDAPRLFGFELESTENLSFIPLVVRFNLDRFGQRISLDEWRRLPHSDRELLAVLARRAWAAGPSFPPSSAMRSRSYRAKAR